MPTSNKSELLEQVQYLIGSGRFQQAVEYLNLSSPYRFTALYRISSDQLQNLVIYDRESEKAPTLETIPLGDSYCAFVRDLMAGEVFGTVCHFDFASVPEDPISLEALKTIAEIFDPSATSELLARGVKAKVDALEAMLGLLVESCDDPTDVITAFEEFARPIRTGALQLMEPSRTATNARVDELLFSLPSRYASKYDAAL
jgi:hypothetical protein